MDINAEYGYGYNPVSSKLEFILSLIEQIYGSKPLSPAEKSIIDRCLRKVYDE